MATYIATAGFDAYQWNTGDTTNSITFSNPVAGTVYQVTVTSSTGCTLVLTDTLPVIEELPPPLFDPLRDTLICKGDGFWIKPTGENLPYVYSVELDYPADSFYVSPPVTTTYSFYTKDKYGCKSDTATMVVEVVDLDFEIIADKPCGNVGTGSILIRPTSGSAPYEFFLDGNSTGSLDSFPILALGNYEFGLEDGHGCMLSRNYLLNGHPVPKIQVAHADPAVCGRQNGSITVVPNGIPSTLQYWLDDGVPQNSPDFSGLDSGTYIVHLMNEFGCEDSTVVSVVAFEAPYITQVWTDSATCNLPTGQIHVTVTGGMGPLGFALNSTTFQSNTTFQNLAPGVYAIYVRDAAGCLVSQQVEVHAISFPRIIEIETAPATCGFANGVAHILTTGGTPPFAFRVENLVSPAGDFDALPQGLHRAEVTDALGCTATEAFYIDEIEPPLLFGIEFQEQDCAGAFAVASLDVRNGVPPYAYSDNGGNTWTSNPDLRALHPGAHQIQAIDMTGCLIDTVIVISSNNVFIPNVFTPNGDGINDLFAIQIEAAAQSRLTRFDVFDRWGNLVYDGVEHAPDYDLPAWDGTVSGKYVAQGVYVYVLAITMDDGRQVCRSGDVTVVR
jgi:gliding motility-associated-like protein